MTWSLMTTSFDLSLPIVMMGCEAFKIFSAGRKVFIGERRQIADSMMSGRSNRRTLRSLRPQWQCIRTRCNNRVPRLICSCDPRNFTCASSGAHSTSAPLSSARTPLFSGVIRCSTRFLGTGISRVGMFATSREKSIGVVSTLRSPGTAAAGKAPPGMAPRPAAASCPDSAASIASNCDSAVSPSSGPPPPVVKPAENLFVRGRFGDGASSPESSSSSSSSSTM
mmetsp:Transcript_90164/g.176539  ORF Transcript_90164/g.176539 Transcript_90164/m.176539 type:complete len:224 (-) Transcript_90164:65-736(-)